MVSTSAAGRPARLPWDIAIRKGCTMAYFLGKFLFTCCWLLTIFSAVKHVSSGATAEEQQDEQPQQSEPNTHRTATGDPSSDASVLSSPNLMSSANPSAPPLPHNFLHETVLPASSHSSADVKRHPSELSPFSGYHLPAAVDSSAVPGYPLFWPSAYPSAVPQTDAYLSAGQKMHPGSSSSSSSATGNHYNSTPLLAQNVLPMPPNLAPQQPQHQIPADLPPPPENHYPLSRRQVQAGITQREMSDRIRAQMAAVDHYGGQRFLPELQQIVQSNSERWHHLFRRPYRTVLKTWSELLMDTLEDAIGDSGTWLKKADADSSDLIEILVTTTREQKKAMGLGRNFCEKMIKHFELIKSPRYLRLMWSLCMERRDQSLKIDQGTAQELSRTISSYLGNEVSGGGNLDADASAAADIYIGYRLAKNNYEQLRDAFNQIHDLGGRLEKLPNRKKHFWQAIRAIHTDVQLGRPVYFANLLEKKLKKLTDMNLVSVGTNYVDAHQDIARILVTRAQIDLADIVEEFDRKEFAFEYLLLRSDRKKYGLLDVLAEFRDHKTWPWDAAQKARLEAYMEIVKLVQKSSWKQMLQNPTLHY